MRICSQDALFSSGPVRSGRSLWQKAWLRLPRERQTVHRKLVQGHAWQLARPAAARVLQALPADAGLRLDSHSRVHVYTHAHIHTLLEE